MHTSLTPEPAEPRAVPHEPLIREPHVRPECLAVLDAIAAHLWAWVSRERLIAQGHSVETLAELESTGWVVPWEIAVDAVDVPSSGSAPAGSCVTLSCQASDRLGVEVVEQGVGDRPRWGKGTCPGDGGPILPGWWKLPEASPSVLAQKFLIELRLPAGLASREPGPAEQAEAREIAAMTAQYATIQVVGDDGEPLVDEATGKPVIASVLCRGHGVPVSDRIRGKRGE